MLHVIGDLHQPLHVAEFFSTDFPQGDALGVKRFVKDPLTGEPIGTAVGDRFIGGYGDALTGILDRTYPTARVDLRIELPLRDPEETTRRVPIDRGA